MKQRGFMLLMLIGVVVFVLAAASPAPAAVSVNGYVLTLIKWEDKIAGHELPKLGIGSTPRDGVPELDNNQFTLDSRQTRFWIGWTDDVQGIKMSGRIEMDFNSTDGNALTSNSRHPRLRIAYARADHPGGFFLLAGQYQSIVASTDIAFLGKYAIDEFNSAVGSNAGVRQPQVRGGWTTKMPGGGLTLEAAVEKNSVANLGSALVDESQGEGQETPFFAARVIFDHPIVRLQGAVGMGKATVTLGNPAGTPAGTPPAGSQESETAWIVNGDVEIKPIPMLTFFAHVYTLNGLGRFLGGAGDFPSVGLTALNKLELIKATGGYGGVSFQLTPNTAINAFAGHEKADEEASIGFTGNFVGDGQCLAGVAIGGNCWEKHTSYHVVLRQRFWQRWLFGLQYNHYKAEAFGGAKGDFNMIESAIFYFF